jgi:cell division septation protein DedD
MYSSSDSRALENGQFMGNKQVIAIFVAGIFLMAAAFWAGLSIIRGSATDGNQATAPAGKAIPPPKSPEAAPAKAAENTPPAVTSSASSGARYIVRVAAYGTQEEAQKIVDELKGERYLSAHVRQPDTENPLFRVFIGPFELREAAQQVANELAAAGKKGLMIYQDNEK